MILTVSGWRRWTDPRFVVAHLERQLLWYGNRHIHLRVGCCPTGADKFTCDWARANHTFLASYTVYYADWNLLGRRAGPIRNGKMLRGQDNPKDPHPNVHTDKLLAFPQPGVDWCKGGSGTTGCILDAKDLRVDLDIPGFKG